MHPPRVSLLRFTNELVLPLTFFLLTLFILASPYRACALTPDSNGRYTIITSADLIEFNERINGIKGNPIPLSADVLLSADIDLSDANGKPMDWTPISGDYDNPYTGTFDGAGHSVKGYEITKTVGDGYAGFFSYIGEKDGKKGVVRGLTVEGGVKITSVTGNANAVKAGAIAGLNKGTIESCRSTAAVIVNVNGKTNHAGGVAGQNDGEIIDCAATGGVSAENSNAENNIGGISGWNDSGTITSCLNDGPVAAKGDSSNYAGGIAGKNNGKIYNSASRTPASASGKKDNQAGGIAAQSGGKIENCANLGDISVSADAADQPNNAGGIVGNTSGSGNLTIGSCANSGRVTLTVVNNNQSFRGGVLGNDTGKNATIENCAWLEGTAEHGVGSDTSNTKAKKLNENDMKNAVTTLTAQTAARRIAVNNGSTTITLITLPGTPETGKYSNYVKNAQAETANSDIITIGKSEIDSSGKITVTAKSNIGDAAVALSADLCASDFSNPGGAVTSQRACSFTRAIEVVTPIAVTGVEISSNDITLEGFGRTAQLSARVKPDNATNQEIVWSSSNPGIAKVDENGNVTSNSPGTATIWAAASENQNISADCKVTVSEVKITSITLNNKDFPNGKISLHVGEQFTAPAFFTPAWATNRDIEWIGDASVISLDRVEKTEKGETATFTAIKEGKTTVKAKTKDGTVESWNTLEITVLKPTVWVDRIELSKEAMRLQSGEHEKLTAAIYPEEASDKRIKWTSSSESVATVSENGEVVAHNPGQTVVTAKALGAKEGTVVLAGCIVTVTAPPVPVELVTISPLGRTLKIGDTFQFTAEILPKNASYKGVTWKSDDEKVATVDANGKVTAVEVGFAAITVTTDDGLKTAEAAVSVNRVYTSGSGCAAGVGALALFALLPLLLKKRRPTK